MEQPPGTVGGLLREHRLRAAMTQRELARRAGVSVRALRDIERGRVGHPRSRLVEGLAAGLCLADPDYRRLLSLVGSGLPTRDGRLHFGVLGPLSVRRGEVPVDVTQARLRCLLGLLAVQPDHVVGREEIVDVLWGEQPPYTCLALVHTYVAQLRELLEPGRQRRTPAKVVVRAAGGYLLAVDADQLDALRFDELTVQARHAHAAGDSGAAATLFGQALAVWRGPVLVDLDPRLRQHPAAVALSQRRLAAALAHADLAIGLGRYEEGVASLRALGHEEPLHEGLHARLMLALATGGQQAAALRLFAELRARLSEELGIEPGVELQQAHLRVLRQQLPAAVVAGPGEHPSTDTPTTVQAPARLAKPAQLPADVAAFTGRSQHLGELDRLLESGADTTAVVLSAIAGTAGVGKTALAVHWAHRARHRFGDGQLYINLRGYAPTPPMRSIDALAGFLRALGVPAEHVPVDLDEAAGLFRTLLADKRMLVLLDNARSAEQIRPLLPGSPGCLVVVTSRDRLGGLVARDGARRLILDVLTPGEAVELLARILGAQRVTGEPQAAEELARVCALLPLAVRIAAANLANHSDWRIADYATWLRQDDQLAELAVDGDPQAAVRTAFDCSYVTLDPDSQRLFRLLGLVPGPDFTELAAAALAGVPVGQAARLLERLAAAHLVESRGPGRFGFHDLLRRYAHQHAWHTDGRLRHDAAIQRLLSWYMHTVDAAVGLLYPDPLCQPPGRQGGSRRRA